MAANGDLLVSGWSVGPKAEASVAALRPDGSLRRSFGRDGVVRIPTTGGARSPSVEVEPDGSIWLAWSVIQDWDTYRTNYQIAHLRPNGGRDASFGDRGDPHLQHQGRRRHHRDRRRLRQADCW